MGIGFSETDLRDKIEALAGWQCLVFILIICQRLMPSFHVFSDKTGYGGAETLDRLIVEAWDNLSSGVAIKDLSEQAEIAGSIAPNTEEFDCTHVSSALDAANAIGLLMRAFKGDQARIAVEVGMLVRDSVDMYVQDIENYDPQDPELEEKILHHELMQQELGRQKSDIEYLVKLDGNIKASMRAIKEKWQNNDNSAFRVNI